MAFARFRIAQAWAVGVRAKSPTLTTDGNEVRSYSHQIGRTEPDGTNVAYDCRYSATTATHSRAIQRVAGRTIPCPSYGHDRRVL